MSMYCEEVNQSSSLYLNGCSEVDDWGNESKQQINDPLVVDDEKGKLVMASTLKKGKLTMVKEAKTMAAMKSHSEAERRRRERINAHLVTLKDLIPHNEKMDKATLLAEVINQVKQLKITATQACKDHHIPMDSDEVKVEILPEKTPSNGKLLIQASLCCDYRPDLVSHIRKAINELTLKILKCEISTLGGRIKSVLFIAPQVDENATSWEETGESVHNALRSILSNVSASNVDDQELLYPQKRRRASILDSSSDHKLESKSIRLL